MVNCHYLKKKKQNHGNSVILDLSTQSFTPLETLDKHTTFFVIWKLSEDKT